MVRVFALGLEFCGSKSRLNNTKDVKAVADLEGVSVVRLNPPVPLGPNYFSFMGKFIKKEVKC